ncbi:ATP-binding protein [Thiocapsa bogorovii]|uniref:ATP-binding protein n=1 Tax=Thiocapsa bogorovii TaxID=521689 RepID=UPI001E37A741|nr:ATP-binding protein [Thiocapsa bogorovii]UHD14743.1 ATP-binding protein [Thiocapsa bogorovii]
MIDRNITPQLRALAGYYPLVAVTGPRQSGKTTLCRAVFPDRPYVSLEALDLRAFAQEDPRGFLAEYQDGAVLDEIQRVPGLLSYLQTEVDERPEPGRFILTGSQHLGLSEAIAQSLAGRCGLLTLLPPSLDELTRFQNAPDDLYTLLWQGAYPRIYDRGIPAHQWLAGYLATYVQRDVRQIVNVADLQTFSGFLRLCAGHSAQEVNLSALGADAGVSHNTARAWLSVLETSFVLHRLPAWHANLRKQMVKAPKLHLFDSGLLCYLLGIQEPAQLRLHPLRGAVFESWAVAEVYKAQTNQGRQPALFHYRESRGIEIDLLVEYGLALDALEIKSGATVVADFFKHLPRFAERLASLTPKRSMRALVVYGGDASQRRTQAQVVSWRDLPGVAVGPDRAGNEAHEL